MANKLYEETYIQAIATAIRGKNGTSTTYKVSQMAAAIAALPTGMTINNGTIKQYKSQISNVSKNNFVEFSYFQNSRLSTSNAYVNSVSMGNNKILTVRPSASNKYNASISSIDTTNNDITTLTDTQIHSGGLSTAIGKKLIKISSTEYIYFYVDSRKIYSIPLTISGTTITVGTEQLVLDCSSYTNGLQYIADYDVISTNKIFIIYDREQRLYGVVADYSNGVLTLGTETKISDNTGSYYNAKLCTIDTNKVFIAHSYGTNFYIYGIAATVSGTTITAGTDKSLDSSYMSSKNIAVYCVATNKAIIFKSNYGSYGAAANTYGYVVTITNTDVATGYNVAIKLSGSNSGSAVGYLSEVTKIGDNLFALATYDGNYGLHIVMFTIDSSNGRFLQVDIKNFDETEYNSSSIKAIPLSIVDDEYFVVLALGDAQKCSSYMGIAYFDITDDDLSVYTTVKTAASSRRRIDGIALDDITASSAGDVYVLN